MKQKHCVVSGLAVVHAACLATGRRGTVSCVEKWLDAQNDSALTTPQTLRPLAAKHIHLPAREERQENQWLHTQLYHNLPSERSLCFLRRRQNTTLYLHNVCSSLLRSDKMKRLNTLLYYKIKVLQNKTRLIQAQNESLSFLATRPGPRICQALIKKLYHYHARKD